MNKELREPLNNEEGLEFSLKDLTSLFVSENIINYVEGQKVGISVQEYWVNMGGPIGLSKGLNTNLKNGIEGEPGDIELRKLKYG
mmetsp:Transcript_22172/g.16581  ORF Transcript_22172/g.16581 Transcript_22172/m.16581 type:complete len:85 (-) Transcript_22172:2671-2925(-)